MVRYSMARYSTVPYATARYGMVQYGTVRLDRTHHPMTRLQGGARVGEQGHGGAQGGSCRPGQGVKESRSQGVKESRGASGVGLNINLFYCIATTALWVNRGTE